ncbi:MAG: tail fiber protein [Lewinellaceae bacterium]|nr:tail fiber protein [Lewinellaceae bacterium]
MRKLIYSLAWLACSLSQLSGQVAIKSDDSPPVNSALLDVQSPDMGVLLPRMDSLARHSIVNPATGLLVFDESTNSFWYFEDDQWIEIRNSAKPYRLVEISNDSPPYGDKFIGANPAAGLVEKASYRPQTLQLSGSALSISDGNTVDLNATQNQQLVLANDELSISGGNSITLLDIMPVGAIQFYYGAAPPANWLLCDGGNFDAATYPTLAALLGGNTLPDFSGRFPLGEGNSAANGATDHAFGTTSGAEIHTLTESELPRHRHTVAVRFRNGEESGGVNDYSDLSPAPGSHESSQQYYSDYEGGGDPHNNMPPYLTVQLIIKEQ